MNDFYILVCSLYFGELTKKFTYDQFLKYAETHGGAQAWKVKKADYNRLNKAFSGVMLKDKNGRILDALRRENKAERV